MDLMWKERRSLSQADQLFKLQLMENIFLLDAVVSGQINKLLTGILITFLAGSVMLGCSLWRQPSQPGFSKMGLRGWFWRGSEAPTHRSAIKCSRLVRSRDELCDFLWSPCYLGA